MALDVSGLFFFMPVFSFLFVFLVVYALLATTKLLGESSFVNVLVSFILAIIFMSFSSLELYVRTITPWFVVLFVMVFLILLLAGLAGGNVDWLRNLGWFKWVVVSLLVIVFLVAAVQVFNPVFHPDLVVTEGGAGPGIVRQLGYFFTSSQVFGSLLLLVIAGVVAWILTKK